MSTTIVEGVSDLLLFTLLSSAAAKGTKVRLRNAHRNVKRLQTRQKEGNSRLNRNYGLEWMDDLQDLSFRKAFRMNRCAFEELLQLLCTVCNVHSDTNGIGDPKQARNSSGSPVSMRTRLAVSLRWLAGGNYWDICGLYGVCPGSFYSERGPLWPTLYALDEALQNEIVFDVSQEGCRKAADSFAVFSRGRMNHCVCAVDDNFIRGLLVHLCSHLHVFFLSVTYFSSPRFAYTNASTTDYRIKWIYRHQNLSQSEGMLWYPSTSRL